MTYIHGKETSENNQSLAKHNMCIDIYVQQKKRLYTWKRDLYVRKRDTWKRDKNKWKSDLFA